MFGPIELTKAVLPGMKSRGAGAIVQMSSMGGQTTPLPEYDETVGPTREYITTTGGTQPGDPAKAAAAIRRALEAEFPPSRLILGNDALDAVQQLHRDLAAEASAWESVSRGTDY